MSSIQKVLNLTDVLQFLAENITVRCHKLLLVIIIIPKTIFIVLSSIMTTSSLREFTWFI